MRRGPRASALAAAAAVLALVAACGVPEAGAAAVVGDRRVSERELQQATADVLSIVPADAPPGQRITRQTVLGWLIMEPYTTEAARANGDGVSDDDVEGIFTANGFKSEDGSGTPSEPAMRAVRGTVALVKILGQQSGLSPEKQNQVLEKVSADLRAAGVRVNPRYGTFDPAWDPQGRSQPFTVTAGTEANWLVPSPSPVASPPGAPGAEPAPGTEPEPEETPSP